MRASFVSASVTQRVLLRDELQLFLGSWVKTLISEEKSLYSESCEERRQSVMACYFGREGLRSERSRLLKRAASCSLLSQTEISDLHLCDGLAFLIFTLNHHHCFARLSFFFASHQKSVSPSDWTAVLWISIHPLENRSPGSKVRLILVSVEWHMLMNKNHRIFIKHVSLTTY